jgi:hypothetical protein
MITCTPAIVTIIIIMAGFCRYASCGNRWILRWCLQAAAMDSHPPHNVPESATLLYRSGYREQRRLRLRWSQWYNAHV